MSLQWISSKRAAPPAMLWKVRQNPHNHSKQSRKRSAYVIVRINQNWRFIRVRDAGETPRHYVKIKISLWLFIDLNLPPYPLLSSKYQAQIVNYHVFLWMQDLFSLFVAIDSWLYRMFGCMVLSRQNLYDDSRQSQRIPAAPKTELLFRSGGVVQLSVHKISAETIRFRQQFKIKAFWKRREIEVFLRHDLQQNAIIKITTIF